MSDTRTPEQLQQIAAFADALPAAIWVGRAPSGECVYVNREFERVLGITPPTDAHRGNYVGPYGVHLPSGEKYPEAEMPYERVMKARAPVIIDDIVIHRHDGTRMFLRVFASPLFGRDGEIEYVVEAFTDRTREVEAEAARMEGQRQLAAARRLESIGSMAGGIAHDFNNLLGIVTLVAGKLRQDETQAVKLELIRHLEEVAESAGKLTRSLLGFARRGTGQVKSVGLNQIVHDVAGLAARSFEDRIALRLSLDARPDLLRIDPTQLEQTVMNLMMNARDAIEGEGRIAVRTRNVELAAGAHPLLEPGRYLSLEVEDSGKGVPPEVRDSLFEPYVTTKISGTLKGTGMGLSTVYGVAKEQGGHAEVALTSPAGTTMRVYFAAG